VIYLPLWLLHHEVKVIGGCFCNKHCLSIDVEDPETGILEPVCCNAGCVPLDSYGPFGDVGVHYVVILTVVVAESLENYHVLKALNQRVEAGRKLIEALLASRYVAYNYCNLFLLLHLSEVLLKPREHAARVVPVVQQREVVNVASLCVHPNHPHSVDLAFLRLPSGIEVLDPKASSCKHLCCFWLQVVFPLLCIKR